MGCDYRDNRSSFWGGFLAVSLPVFSEGRALDSYAFFLALFLAVFLAVFLAAFFAAFFAALFLAADFFAAEWVAVLGGFGPGPGILGCPFIPARRGFLSLRDFTRLSIGQPLAFCTFQSELGAFGIFDAEGRTVAVSKIKFAQIPVQVFFAAMLIDALHAALED
jgi:hypothetical protein